MSDVICRHVANPLVRPEHIEGNSLGIYNCAVATYEDRYAGVFRVDALDGSCHLHRAFSDDGLTFHIEPEAIELKNQREGHEIGGAYDPRITLLGGSYFITFASGSVIGLAKTDDFKTFELVGNVSLPRNRNAVLFPEKIEGRYARLERPYFNPHQDPASIWFSFSPDLLHWGDHRLVATPSGWCGFKIGPGAPPIRTSEGYLLLFHGVHKTCSGLIYSMGAMLLDLEKPWRVRRRANNVLLSPQAPYEVTGRVPNVIFPCAAVRRGTGDELTIYYGAADTYVCAAESKIADLVEFCLKE